MNRTVVISHDVSGPVRPGADIDVDQSLGPNFYQPLQAMMSEGLTKKAYRKWKMDMQVYRTERLAKEARWENMEYSLLMLKAGSPGMRRLSLFALELLEEIEQLREELKGEKINDRPLQNKARF